jgi:uncharacterized protein (TIGR03643 family)
MPKNAKPTLTEEQIDRVIEMAWEDRTPFDAIYYQFGLREAQVIQLMRSQLKLKSWRLWRKRAHQISHKHAALQPMDMTRFKCNRQRSISQNKISKR